MTIGLATLVAMAKKQGEDAEKSLTKQITVAMSLCRSP